MALVAEDYDVVSLRDDRVDLAFTGSELVDEGENVAVVLFEEPLQVLAAFRSYEMLWLSYGSRFMKVLVDLVVKVDAVCYYQECIVSGDFSEYLLGEEYHAEALTASCCVPEDSKFTFFHLTLHERF